MSVSELIFPNQACKFIRVSLTKYNPHLQSGEGESLTSLGGRS